MRTILRLSPIVPFALILSLAGCTAPVTKISGLVTLDGTPVNGGTISFMNESGTVSTAMIQSDGRYEIANVPNGPVKVTVYTAPIFSADTSGDDLKKGKLPKAQGPEKTKIPDRYGQAETSGLTVEVKGKELSYNAPLTR